MFFLASRYYYSSHTIVLLSPGLCQPACSLLSLIDVLTDFQPRRLKGLKLKVSERPREKERKKTLERSEWRKRERDKFRWMRRDSLVSLLKVSYSVILIACPSARPPLRPMPLNTKMMCRDFRITTTQKLLMEQQQHHWYACRYYTPKDDYLSNN